MRTRGKAWAGLLALGLVALGRTSWAVTSTTTAVLSIDVTVNANVGVNINGATSSTMAENGTVTPGGSPVPASSSATVTSTAGGILEFWKLSSANGVDNSGGADNWTLATSTFGASGPGTDKFAMQAMFVSSKAADCTSGSIPATDWSSSTAPALTTVPAYYRSSSFAGGPVFASQKVIGGVDGTPDIHDGTSADGKMYPSTASVSLGNGTKGLCYRIVPPTGVTTADNQILYVIVTASSS